MSLTQRHSVGETHTVALSTFSLDCVLPTLARYSGLPSEPWSYLHQRALYTAAAGHRRHHGLHQSSTGCAVHSSGFHCDTYTWRPYTDWEWWQGRIPACICCCTALLRRGSAHRGCRTALLCGRPAHHCGSRTNICRRSTNLRGRCTHCLCTYLCCCCSCGVCCPCEGWQGRHLWAWQEKVIIPAYYRMAA